MKMLDRKLLRDLWRVKTQVITIALVVASGVGGFIASLSTYESLKNLQASYYDSARFAHVFARAKRAPLAVEAAIAHIPGVAEAETTVSHDVLLDLPDTVEPLTGRIIALADGGTPRLNRVTLMAGRWIDAPASNQVLVNETFANARKLKPGDRIAALLNGKREQLEIIGIVLSPEYIFPGRSGLGDETSFGIFWMGRERPPPDWGKAHGDGQAAFDEMDLADLFASLSGRHGAGRGQAEHGHGGHFPIPGQDFEVTAEITLEQAAHGTEFAVNLAVPEPGADGYLRRVPRSFKARIAKGASEGQRLRLTGKGGKGLGGGRDGDLYLIIHLLPHPLFRASGHDLYVDLPLAPWEAALGATVEVPTLHGAVHLKVRPGTRSGQKLRLAKRGLPNPREGAGDLYAVVQIVLPAELSERERSLLQQMADASTFDPRKHFTEAAT